MKRHVCLVSSVHWYHARNFGDLSCVNCVGMGAGANVRIHARPLQKKRRARARRLLVRSVEDGRDLVDVHAFLDLAQPGIDQRDENTDVSRTER